MPNRILKQSICTSPNLNKLTPAAERFFYRLMVQCDDFGQFYANPSILRGLCFPMHLNDTSEMDVQDWLVELVRERLINVYEVEGVPYLQFAKWKEHQQIRATKPKYPQPIPVEQPITALLPESDTPLPPAINGNQVKSDVSGGESAPNTNTTPITGTNTNTISNTGGYKPPTKEQLALEPVQILLYRVITDVTPAPENWEKIVNAIGQKTKDELAPYFAKWLEISKNRYNLAWLLEWLASGRPAAEFGAVQRTGGNHGTKTDVSRQPASNAGRNGSQPKPVDPARAKIDPYVPKPKPR